MKQTGELLKSARESAKLSLSEVALSTKINPKILTAIENGDRQSLPALTFLKGFLRSYAIFLKLDPDEVMKVFNAESGIKPPAPPVAAVPAPTPEPPRQAVENHAPTPAPTPSPITKRRVDDSEGFKGLRALAVAVIVVLIGVIIGVRELVEKYQREKVVDTVAEMKVNPLPEAKKEEAKKEEVKKEEAKKEAVEPIKTAETKAEEPKKEEPKKDEPKPEAQPPKALAALPEEPKKEEPKKEGPKKEDASEVKPASIVKSIKSEIILEALDKVEVKFKVHGEAKRVSLGPTQVHTIFADEPMVLDVSDGGAVNIILNGRERGVPGDLGKPAQIKIP